MRWIPPVTDYTALRPPIGTTHRGWKKEEAGGRRLCAAVRHNGVWREAVREPPHLNLHERTAWLLKRETHLGRLENLTPGYSSLHRRSSNLDLKVLATPSS